MYKEARELFIHPDVIDPETIDLKWTDPDEEGIVQYMCNEKGFRYFFKQKKNNNKYN